MEKIIIACSKSWFLRNTNLLDSDKYDIHLISKKEQFTLTNIEQINPRYIFFPHWSWKINYEIYSKYECIVFHTAPLPYGRGGSPIQNLILNGFKESPVCALKVTESIDAGDIYVKKDISLEGDLDTIFNRISKQVEIMISHIIETNPIPKPQEGKIHHFKRLSIDDNEIKHDMTINQIYNCIRMVDSKDFAKAYIIFGDYKIEFTNANFKDNKLIADIKFLKMSD